MHNEEKEEGLTGPESNHCPPPEVKGGQVKTLVELVEGLPDVVGEVPGFGCTTTRSDPEGGVGELGILRVVEEVGSDSLDEELDGGEELRKQRQLGGVEACDLLVGHIEPHGLADPADIAEQHPGVDLAPLAATEVDETGHEQTLEDEGHLCQLLLGGLLILVDSRGGSRRGAGAGGGCCRLGDEVGHEIGPLPAEPLVGCLAFRDAQGLAWTFT